MLQPKLISVEPLPLMQLRLCYETGETRLFDVAPYAEGAWYGELKNDAYFRSVHLLPGGVGIEWRDGQDIAPHELYELILFLNKMSKWISEQNLRQTRRSPQSIMDIWSRAPTPYGTNFAGKTLRFLLRNSMSRAVQ